MLKICELKAFKGRNVYSHQRVVFMRLDLGAFADIPTKDISDFNERIITLLPGLSDHHCSYEQAGGFLKRLKEGTYLAHVVEHTALELLNRLGHPVGFGSARQFKDSIYTVVFAYVEERVSLEAAKQGVALVNALMEGAEFDIAAVIKRLRQIGDKDGLGPSTQAIVDAAAERGIPVTRLGDGGIIQLGYGRYHRKLSCTLSDLTPCISVDISCDKPITKDLLAQSGIQVPHGQVCHSLEETIEAAEDIGYPVVVKPVNGNQGKGVSLNLCSKEEVARAYAIALKVHERVLVEASIPGQDYRVLVVGSQVAAAALRIPAHVIGDGTHTVDQLVEIKNQDSRRGEDHEKPLSKIRVDEIALELLAKQGYRPDSVVRKGILVYLKANGNLSTGGEAVDCTDKIHPFNKEIAVRAARIVGLDIAGVDITCKDIARPINEEGGAVIEVNAAPGIRMHLHPAKGKPRKVGDAIVDMLFPSGSRHSVPIVSITGTNGKTTTTRMVAHILRTHGYRTGMTTTGGIYINDTCILKGDTTGPVSAQALLMDKGVDVVVLETARGGILRSGLGYDFSDIGVLLNISDDHLGLDGVDTLEDMLHVKSLVVEAVKCNGFAVLNADDPLVVKAAERVKARIIYFSRQEHNLILHKHISEGGIAAFIKDGFLALATGNGLIQSIAASQIPLTLGGRLHYNVENALAAVCAAYGLNIPMADIERGLATFQGDELQNPGRFNLYNIRDYRVIIDYAHNTAGIRYVAEVVKRMGASRLVAVLGAPGDRDDNTLMRIGEIAGAAFDRIYVREDKDLRGRKPGEAAELLMRGILRAGMDKDRIKVIWDEQKALQEALRQGISGDLMVHFYEDLELIQRILKKAIEDKTKPEETPMLLKA